MLTVGTRIRRRPGRVSVVYFLSVGGVRVLIGGRGHSATECHPSVSPVGLDVNV